MTAAVLWNRVKPWVPVSCYRLLAAARRARSRRIVRELDEEDRVFLAENGHVVAPPADLRHRVAGALDIPQFLRVGAGIREDMERALGRLGTSLADYQDILDFGCGCGRVVQSLRELPGARLSGTDVDLEAIQWCRENLPFGDFHVNERRPPLPFAEGRFDLVYTISVFTHLNEPDQFAWLSELQRVLRPGGVLLASVHGPTSWQCFPSWTVRKVQRQGFLYFKTNGYRGIFPEWYQMAWHAEEYVRREWSRYFEVADYIPESVQRHHDLVVLRRCPEPESAKVGMPGKPVNPAKMETY